MPRKPKPTRVARDGTIVPNENRTAAHGALMERNVARRDFAIRAEFEDINAGNPTKGRYVRVRERIEKYFNCSQTSAERAMRAAEIHLAERFDAELPAERAKTCRQLQQIADEQEQKQPHAAVAALALKAKIVGMLAPKKIEVTHGASPELALQLDAILVVLSDAGRAALDVVLAEIEAAKRDGRLALPESTEEHDEIEDAEIVESEPAEPGEPGTN